MHKAIQEANRKMEDADLRIMASSTPEGLASEQQLILTQLKK